MTTQLIENNTYTLERKIAEGPHSVIFEAKEIATEEVVVLKVISLENEQSRQGFEREVKYSHLLHPNLLQILCSYTVGSLGVLVTERMEMNLFTFLFDYSSSLSLAEVNFIYAEVSKALLFLHHLHIAHLNLKPENVLIKRDHHGKLTVKLCDLSLATPFLDHPLSFGCPEYLAPEYLSYSPSSPPSPSYPLDKADVWSIGVLLFVMLTGRYPFIVHDQSYFRMDISRLKEMIMEFKCTVDDELMEKQCGKCIDLLMKIFVDHADRPDLSYLLIYLNFMDIADPYGPVKLTRRNATNSFISDDPLPFHQSHKGKRLVRKLFSLFK